MTRYADPYRCPDCRSTISPGAASCGSCALPLRGENAQRLFQTLSQADDLVAALRSRSTSLVPAGTTPMPVSRPVPAPGAPARRTRFSLGAASVPTILLTLGAGCLLVASLVFLVVAWSVLGVGGRTAALVVLTSVAGGLAGWLARRGLRGAAESLALVGYGLLSLDITGAKHAGWLGEVAPDRFLQVLGATLAVTGAAGALAARRTPLRLHTGAEVVCAIGTALVACGVAVSAQPTVATSLVAATLTGAAATAVTYRLRLQSAFLGCSAVTATAWLSLTGYALQRTLEHADGWRQLWVNGQVWPLLVSAALVAALALLRRLPVALRIGGLAAAHLLLVCAVLAPVTALDATTLTLAGLGLLVVTGAATWLLPRPWGLVNVLTQAVTSTGLAMVALVLAVRSADRLGDAAAPVWSGHAGDLLPTTTAAPDLPAAWLLPLCVVALLGTVWSLAVASPQVDRLRTAVGDLRVAAGLLVASAVAALALYPVPLWLVLVALLAATAVCTARWLGSGSTVPLVLAAAFGTAGLGVSMHAEWLTAAATVAALGYAGSVLLRGRRNGVAAAGGGLLAAAVAGSVWTFGAVADAAAAPVVLVGLGVLGVVVLLAPSTPSRWWACPGPAQARTGLEVGAALCAVPLATAGLQLAPAGDQAAWAAAYLTVAGAVVTVMSLARADRRALGRVGGLLLVAASWVRLWDLGVGVPEAYTLPSAAVLLVVGLDRLHRDPRTSTMTALAPGLALALVPSLLWSLAEPTGLRTLLLGLGCLLLVLAGSRLHWTAPVLLGAGVGALLVLRLAAPYVGEAVPRWVLIGIAGVLLVALGATWERRLAGAKDLADRVRALR